MLRITMSAGLLVAELATETFAVVGSQNAWLYPVAIGIGIWGALSNLEPLADKVFRGGSTSDA